MNNRISPRAGWRGDFLAAGAGALVPWAFAPYDLYPLAIAGPALLFAVLRGTTPGVSFRRGWLFGLAMFGLGVSWVHISMHRFGGLNIPFSVFLTALFAAFLALFPATLGYLAAKWFPETRQRRWLSLLVVLPSLWVLLEWLRGLIFTGFPWLNLGYSQIDTPLRGYAPILGVYGLSLFTVVCSGLIVLLFERRSAWLGAISAAAVIWGGGAALAQIEWSHTAGEPVSVSLIQGNVPQDVKWHAEQREPTLELYTELTRQHLDSRLIVWPETALPAFYHQARPFLRALAAEAHDSGAELLIGLPVFNSETREYYNSMLNIGRDEGFYHKQHLVPFGEYIPLQGLLGPLLDVFDIPMSDFSPGAPDQGLLTVAGYKVGISICYEDAFGEEVVRGLPAAAFLVNASNDAWFGESAAPHQHLQIARMRALETGRYLLRATNTGVSAIVAPTGRILAKSPQFQAHVLTGEILPRTGATPYVYLGNLALLLVTGIALSVGRAVSRKH